MKTEELHLILHTRNGTAYNGILLVLEISLDRLHRELKNIHTVYKLNIYKYTTFSVLTIVFAAK